MQPGVQKLHSGLLNKVKWMIFSMKEAYMFMPPSTWMTCPVT